MSTARFRDNLRMVLAIASKDIVDAFRSSEPGNTGIGQD